MVFFFLDEKETGQRCKGIFETVCAAGIQDQTICHAQAKLLRVRSGYRAVSFKD